jgi:transcriptional regulator with AAA-type ATPase domain
MSGDTKRSSSAQTTRRSDSLTEASRDWTLGIRWLAPAPGAVSTWFRREPTLLGRGEDCDGHLPGVETSRHHAEVVRQGPLWVIRDLGSTNGVYLNGTRVSSTVLSVGDILRLGEWIGLVTQTVPDSADAVRAFACEEGLVAGPVFAPIVAMARRGARTDLPLVVQGETGTGKELVARAVHAWSGRLGPFLPVNCAALPASLAEAELFGYRKGAFTGADRANPGHFRAAQKGTLFLDEIADLPLSLQPKLLRAIEQREVTPVGESIPVEVNVRIVAATQSPLRERVLAGTFRPDLQARLDGITVVLPPLRKRIEEVPYLFDWFLRKHSGGHPPAVEARLIEELCLYDWPSNVRELELLARRLIGLSTGKEPLKRSDLPEHMLASRVSRSESAEPARPADGHGAKEARDVAKFIRALRLHAGNVARAAADAGIPRSRAYRLLEMHPEIDLEAYRRVARRGSKLDTPDDGGDT